MIKCHSNLIDGVELDSASLHSSRAGRHTPQRLAPAQFVRDLFELITNVITKMYFPYRI